MELVSTQARNNTQDSIAMTVGRPYIYAAAATEPL